MARVTITVEDLDGGRTGVGFEFVPPVTMQDGEDLTKAQRVGADCFRQLERVDGVEVTLTGTVTPGGDLGLAVGLTTRAILDMLGQLKPEARRRVLVMVRQKYPDAVLTH